MVTRRINRAIELLAQGQAIYYVDGHTGNLLTHDRGRQDAHIWADYITRIRQMKRRFLSALAPIED